MIQPDEIHVFIPAYNEARMIGKVVSRLQAIGYSNVYIINDGSNDNTIEETSRIGAKVISHLINRGAGAATQTGVEYARLKKLPYVVFLDGDGQHFPKSIEFLKIGMDQNDCDIVIGSRFMDKRSPIPRSRKVYNRIANFITNFFCTGRYTDSQSGFRMLNRQAIETLDLHIDGFGYCSEMIIIGEKSGLRIKEVPIEVAYSEYSMSKGQDFHGGVSTAIDLLRKMMIK